ncbi:MAG: class I SAM-dependent methyltransferase [Verrucomicrobiia bacterium]
MLKHFIKTTAVGRLLLIPLRFGIALSHQIPLLKTIITWTFRSKEFYNFSYDLNPLNRQYYISFIASLCQQPYATIENYFLELEGDKSLQQFVIAHLQSSPDKYTMDLPPHWGKRLGWYALVRALKPKYIVETGVDKGLGSCVLAAALLHNQEEGHEGKLLGIDISPKAGQLFQSPYASVGKIVIGDSLETLKNLEESVDFFIHDSDHSESFEMAEYQAVAPKLAPNAILLTDNGYFTNTLLNFAKQNGRSYLYFQDRPFNHWWPGDGLGIAWKS